MIPKRHDLPTSYGWKVEDLFLRCDACGQITRVDRTPMGTRYPDIHEFLGVDPVTGKNTYLVRDELGGCRNCGCVQPWGGLELGDQSRPYHRKTAPHWHESKAITGL